MSGLIISPADEAPVKGVSSDLDSIGRGSAEPIEGNKVVLTVQDLPTGPSTTRMRTVVLPASLSRRGEDYQD
jgi:hypothetical protein